MIFLLSALILGIAGLAYPSYAGSPEVFLFFTLAYLSMLLLVFPKPRLYVFTFFALFLFLGFWAKLAAYLISGYDFVEPVGDFDGTSDSWDHTLIAASVASVGVSLARLIHLYLSRYHSTSPFEPTGPYIIPGWYYTHRKVIWVSSAILVLGLNAWNFDVAFYQIGVNPKLILPFHLNVLTGWLINIGFAIWLAVIVYWETLTQPNNAAKLLLVPVAEAFVSAASTLSRSLYLFHAVPYFFALAENKRKLANTINVKTKILLTALFLCGFASSLLSVQVLRTNVYFIEDDPLIAQPESSGKRRSIPQSEGYAAQIAQISWLFIYRWIGMEGVLVVSAHPETGMKLFYEGITENPKKGIHTLYQKIAKPFYRESKKFTFLTLPGIVGVLLYSGSLIVVISGMITIALLMIVTEVGASRCVGNPFLLSVIGLAMANVICQLNFPYLAGVFFAQLWVALAFIWFIQRLGSKVKL